MSEVMPPGGGEQPPGYGSPPAPPDYGPPPPPPPPPPGGMPAPERPEMFEPPPAYAPTGGGSAAHYGAPLASHDPGAYINPASQGPVYAGFWRRAWARWITAQVSGLVVGTGYSLILFGTFWVYENTAVCSITPSGQQVCVSQVMFLWIGLGVSWAFGIGASYYIWSRRLSTQGATVGMAQMGLSIRGAATLGPISKGRALRRSFIALLPAVFLSGVSWVFLFSPSSDLLVIAYVGLGVLSTLVALGGLWSLFDSRRRTLWDIVGDTVVVVDREPSWFSVVAVVFASLVPSAIALTFTLIGLDQLRERFDDVSNGSAPLTRALAYVLPVALASIGAIVFGHLGVRSTKWDARRLSGRGIAVAGLVVGYSVPVFVVMGLLFSLLYDKLSDREERSCKETRKEIFVAAESFKLLNGRYPSQISEINLSVYMNEEELGEEWAIATRNDVFRVRGKGDCKDA